MSGDSIDPEIMGCNKPEGELQSSEHILNAMCDLSDFLYLGTTGDIQNEPKVRTMLLQEIRHWRSNICFFTSAQASSTPEVCLLR
jgi:hypothetical protein